MSVLTEFPEAITSASDFPRPVTAAIAERASAREAAAQAARALRLAERETFAEAEMEQRLLTTEGTLPEPSAADHRTARVAAATRQARIAESALALGERRFDAAVADHAETLRELAERMAGETQTEVIETGRAFLAALETRESLYALAGRPGSDDRGPLPDVPGTYGQVYFMRRGETGPRLCNADGIPFPTLPQTLERISAAVYGFPLGEGRESAGASRG